MDVAARGVATFLLKSMSLSSSSFTIGVSDKYLELEVSFSLSMDADAYDPYFSVILLRALPMVHTFLLRAFDFTIPFSHKWVDLFEFFLVRIMFEFPLP
jgi:hypothetical protein